MKEERKHTESITLGETEHSAPLEVVRVAHATGTHIEPPLDQLTEHIDKLRWLLGVLKVDHGIVIHVTEIRPGVFSLHGSTKNGSWGQTGRDYFSAWDFINGCFTGAELAEEKND